MRNRVWCARMCAATAALLAGCGSPAPEGPKVLIGATLFDGSGGTPVARSVVVVNQEVFKAVGDQPTLPIPAGSEKTDLTGRYLIPAPVPLPDDANFPRFRTQEALRALVAGGARVVNGVPVDTGELDAPLLEQIKQKGVLVFPSLTVLEAEPHHLLLAKANAKRMFDAGVKLGVDGDRNAHREWKFLSEAGVPAGAIIQATTVHAAEAAKRGGAGRIAAGQAADLYVLKCDPREDISCLAKVERAMVKGAWAPPPALGEN